ncbi:hypothetical protein [Marinomonas spartinae]|uniref:hypothetical protein n=1 Tax=Marinomonas spartinae TaxID=1792290 RepID=UPI0015862967|nr:hypothetical protein [Marinomonas spartinae]
MEVKKNFIFPPVDCFLLTSQKQPVDYQKKPLKINIKITKKAFLSTVDNYGDR